MPVGFYFRERDRLDRFDDDDVRQAAWWSVLAGACGHTYGDNNVWQMWQPGRQPVLYATTAWTEALDHPGAAQMGILRRFMEAHAFQTLVDKKEPSHQQFDPECVVCHTVGFRHPTGYYDPPSKEALAKHNAKLENVGCENCHSPAGRHAANPTKVRLPKVGAASCASCHNPEQSPGFDFGRFWAKIRH